LILTDNQIAALPDAIGNCTHLQKLMLAGNRLADLPEAMRGCVGLELLRISANRLQALPEWLLQLPRLTWLAFGGNPFSAVPRHLNPEVPHLQWQDLDPQGALAAILAGGRASGGGEIVQGGGHQ
jgi:Leucine-rich repeat (LRR) protein